MKTGTTFVQGLLMQNRERLAAAGLLIPGERWVDQLHAVRDVLGGGPGYPDVGPAPGGIVRGVGQLLKMAAGILWTCVREAPELALRKRRSASRVMKNA